jgi:hypothetical protein
VPAGSGGPQIDVRHIAIDLGAVEQLATGEGDMFAHYLRMIEVQRGGFNGRMLTIRRRDLTAIAGSSGRHPYQVPAAARRAGPAPCPLTRCRTR